MSDRSRSNDRNAPSGDALHPSLGEQLTDEPPGLATRFRHASLPLQGIARAVDGARRHPAAVIAGAFCGGVAAGALIGGQPRGPQADEELAAPAQEPAPTPRAATPAKRLTARRNPVGSYSTIQR